MNPFNFSIMVLVQLLLLILGIKIGETCTDVCVCSVERNTCYLSTCNDDLPRDFTMELVVHGELCERHRTQLKENVDNIIIHLIDDYYNGLENCL